MIQIISILLEQLPSKIGDGEKSCVDKSIRICLQIVKEDLDIINKIDKQKINDMKDKVDPFPPNNSSFIRNMIEACPTINALGHIFDRKKVYYKENDRHRWTNAGTGDPEKRSQWIQVFRRNRGFNALIQFMNLRAGSVIDGDGDNLLDDIFPNIKLCRDLLGAIVETLPKSNTNSNDPGESDMQSAKAQCIISEVRALSKVIMEHVLNMDERVLKKLDQTIVAGVRGQLHYMYKKLNKLESSATPQNPTSETPLNDFFTFWRALALKLITSQSLPLKLFGWNEIDALIKEAKSLAPPPRAYRVSGAGTAFVNGIYESDKKMIGSDGYVKDTELQYHHKVPDKIVLRRALMEESFLPTLPVNSSQRLFPLTMSQMMVRGRQLHYLDVPCVLSISGGSCPRLIQISQVPIKILIIINSKRLPPHAHYPVQRVG